MRKKFERRRNIERATSFKAIYVNPSEDPNEHLEREFKSLKSMSQWIARGDDPFYFILFGRLALIDDIWEAFDIIGKKCVTLSDLKQRITDLEKIQP
ncbi:MAG: hypothetical protein SNI70_10755 [Rikenellaceae bacterium]